MRWWIGLLPYFIVRKLAFKYCEKYEHSGMIYYKSVGEDWICRKKKKGKQHDK